jgi:hypothetical protein
LPVLERMGEKREQFVAAHTPFRKEERRNRGETRKSQMPRADVAISEKYRRILEAYQIELEYGRTLEAYEGTLADGRTVTFVRLGRISLMYQTQDGQETGYWDAQQKNWVVDNSYAERVASAISVARKEGAPDLLQVPVPAPQEVRS